MYRGALFLLSFAFCGMLLHAGPVHVSILNGHTVSVVVISPETGTFHLIADGEEVAVLNEDEPVYVSMIDDQLILRNSSGPPGIYYSVSFIQADEGGNGVLAIRPVIPAMDRVFYFGDLDLSVDYERIKMINSVRKDLYLAGVVEAEAGLNSSPMFYKAQAVICRTYLFGNISRHMDEGFHMCDEVHCQVYKGRLTSDGIIAGAVKDTEGKVLTYGGGELITAAFHSNCGGQTINSGDVWIVQRPYLRSVDDPYCTSRPNAKWQRRIETEKWRNYMVEMGMVGSVNHDGYPGFAFKQHRREVFYTINGISLPLRQIRSDWNLKSTYFDVSLSGHGNYIIFSGKGFGHGAGLCQEGAMEMASRGHNFIEILKFYYTGISVDDIKSLQISGH